MRANGGYAVANTGSRSNGSLGAKHRLRALGEHPVTHLTFVVAPVQEFPVHVSSLLLMAEWKEDVRTLTVAFYFFNMVNPS